MRFLFSFTALLCISFVQLTAQTKPYQEKYRPQFHFSPPAHWMNDPNGMVYYKGEYHLFYQYYPDSTVWGPMHWGHAISKDLMRWQHLPTALYPDSLGYIFSGSVVVDKNNSSGFQQGKESALVAIYTYHNMAGEKAGKTDFQTQGIAYSIDKGRTWTKYKNNPVIKNPGIKDFRDPKVIWHEPSKHWILTLAAATEIQFYRSTNLKNWELSGRFGKDEGSHGGVWECPDLFEMKAADGTRKWILLVSIGSGAANGGSGTQYFIGNFDGKNFTNDNAPSSIQWLDYGTDNYAGVTWSNAPNQRKIFLGWMSNWQYAQVVPTQKWRSAMTLPRELNLIKNKNAYVLQTLPVAETRLLRKEPTPLSVRSNKNYPLSLNEIILNFDFAEHVTGNISVELFNDTNEKVQIGFNCDSNRFYINRTHLLNNSFSKEFSATHSAPRLLNSKKLTMHLFIDKSSVELLADDGTVVMTDLFFPSEHFTKFRIVQEKNKSVLSNGKMYTLRSVW